MLGACASLNKATDSPQGIDVSHHQGTIDWKAVQEHGVQFAFIKISEGITYADPKGAANWAGAKAAGLRHGAYHVFVPGDDGTKQARSFLNALKKNEAYHGSVLPPVLDIESLKQAKVKMAHAEILNWLIEVEATLGCKPIIYTSPNSWDKEFPDQFTRYELWLADYASAPKLPKGWKSWTFWQYSQTGKVNGIDGTVDLNRFSGSAFDLAHKSCSG